MARWSDSLSVWLGTALATGIGSWGCIPHTGHSSAWPNEPAGATVFNDWGFDQQLPPTAADQRIPGSPGWNVIYNAAAGSVGSGVFLVREPGAPFSRPNVYRFMFAQGFPAGVGPGNVYHAISTSRVYVAFWWRISNPWTTTTAAQKVLYLMDGASNIVLDMQSSNDPFYIRWVIDGTEYLGDLTYDIHRGTWYRFEILADLGAKTMKWWIYDPLVDAAPVLIGNKTGVAYATRSIKEVAVNPTYGGDGSPAIQDQFFEYDHIHISTW